MKNCNRRVNYCRMLAQNLNFMNTDAENICIYVKSVALLYGLSIDSEKMFLPLCHLGTLEICMHKAYTHVYAHVYTHLRY